MTAVPPDLRADTRARLERVALDLFAAEGFERVTADEIAEAAGISRRTFFRWFPTKADVVWGDFAGHVARLQARLAATAPEQPVLATICAAYLEVNDYPPDQLPVLRRRMRLILGEPALLAHSQLRYADVDHVVAAHVSRRGGGAPTTLLPRLVATSTRAAATTAFEVWLAGGPPLAAALRRAFDELAAGFPGLLPTDHSDT